MDQIKVISHKDLTRRERMEYRRGIKSINRGIAWYHFKQSLKNLIKL